MSRGRTLLRILFPTFVLLALVGGLISLRRRPLVRETVRLGPDVVDVTVHERNGYLYASARQKVPWHQNGWSTTVSLVPTSELRSRPIRIEVDGTARKIVVRVGDLRFLLHGTE